MGVLCKKQLSKRHDEKNKGLKWMEISSLGVGGFKNFIRWLFNIYTGTRFKISRKNVRELIRRHKWKVRKKRTRRRVTEETI